MAATIQPGHTYSTGSSVTAANLNLITSGATISGVTGSEIASNTLTNSNISSSAEIAMSKITATASDATLAATMGDMGILQGFWVYRVDADNIGITTGSAMINGELRRATSAKTDLTASNLDNNDWYDVWILADSAASTVTYSAVDSGTEPGGSTNPGTNGLMIGSIRWSTTAELNNVIQFRRDKITGFGSIVGSGSSGAISENVKFGKTFDFVPVVHVNALGRANQTTPITTATTGTTIDNETNVYANSTQTNQFSVIMRSASTWSASYMHGYVWTAEGSYS